MSTVKEVLQAAWRRSGQIGMGVVIGSAQAEVGLERLQAFYKDMSEGLFGRMEDKILNSSDAYEAQEFERVINTAGATVTFPASLQDQYTGETRTPMDGAIIVVTVPGVDPSINIYDANRAEWQNLSGLGINDHAPLSNRWDDALKNILAVLIADDVGGQVTSVLAKRAGSGRLSIASRYGSTRRTTPTEFY